MILFSIIALILLVIACVCFIQPLVTDSKQVAVADRDDINKQYYHSRLDELNEDAQQGIVGQHDELVKELQQNLLVDIPETQLQQAENQSNNAIVIILGVITIVAITLVSYAKTGGIKQVVHMQEVESNYPVLLTKFELGKISPQELQDFVLALRSRVFDRPNGLDDLLMLGEAGMQLNSYPIASQAFAHAYKLDPNNPDVLSFHGYITLMYAQTEGETRLGLALLNQALKQNPNNLFVIKALAFYSLESKETNMMLYYWNMWLEKLPADSPNREMVMSTLNYIHNMIAEKKQDSIASDQ